jgi:hypothetical protein
MTLKCYYVNYGWKQCRDIKLFEEEEGLGTKYLTKQPQVHCLCVDLFLFSGILVQLYIF